MGQQTHSNPNRWRWIALAIMVLGLGIAVLDNLYGSGTDERGLFRLRSIWGVIAVSLVGLAIVLWAFVFFACRCPFCGKWIEPWYYPRPGMHCPKCGKTRK